MKPIAEKGFTFLLTNELYWSKAYQSLNKSARNLLWAMVQELRFTGSWKKRTHEYINNGKISFTETEFKKQGLGSSATYLKARNQLIEVGLIEITYRGGYARGDMNTYKLMFIRFINLIENGRIIQKKIGRMIFQKLKIMALVKIQGLKRKRTPLRIVPIKVLPSLKNQTLF